MTTAAALSTLAAVALFSTAALAPQAALAHDHSKTAKDMQRERQQLAKADRPAAARTGQAEPAAAHEGKPRHRTAAEMQRARQHLPAPSATSDQD